MDDLENFSKQAFNFFVEQVNHAVEETQKIMQDVEEQTQTFVSELLQEGERQYNEKFNQPQNCFNQPREALRRKLFPLVHGDWHLASRLIASARRSNPGHSEDWYWEKVIYDLERDHQ